MAIMKHLEEKRKFIAHALDHYLPPEEEYPQSVHKAMRYSVFAGGKRVRPLLVLLSAELFNPDWQRAVPAACALELIHTYSLIHDDLPAMDDDHYRRGRLTSHKVFGEALAILAGDALLTLAFEILGSARDALSTSWGKIEPGMRLQVVSEMAAASGVRGMVGGQVVDLESEGKKIGSEIIKYINLHKTGALLKTAVRTGALLAGCTTADLKKVTAYASALGEAFQLVDDLLDVEGDEEKTGKKSGMDAEKKKSNYVSLFGLSATKKKRDELYHRALQELDPYGESAASLREFTRFIFYRDY